MIDWPDPDDLLGADPHVIIDHIIDAQVVLAEFWSRAHGWAPRDAADLLTKSRLDWQVSLSRSLHHRVRAVQASPEAGELIIAWANLGALVEGSLKLFLAVWYGSYAKDIDAIFRRGQLRDPDTLALEELRQFFVKKGLLEPKWLEYVELVQSRRNAIHAFHDRDLGTVDEFTESVCKYHGFLREVASSLPWPEAGP